MPAPTDARPTGVCPRHPDGGGHTWEPRGLDTACPAYPGQLVAVRRCVRCCVEQARLYLATGRRVWRTVKEVV